MAFTVYHNPYDVTIGGTPLTGVTAVATQIRCDEIHAAGDGQTHETVAHYATAGLSGAITTLDPQQAALHAGAVGTITFKWTDAKGATPKTVTITGATIVGWRSRVSRGAASIAVVDFIAESLPSVSS